MYIISEYDKHRRGELDQPRCVSTLTSNNFFADVGSMANSDLWCFKRSQQFQRLMPYKLIGVWVECTSYLQPMGVSQQLEQEKLVSAEA